MAQGNPPLPPENIPGSPVQPPSGDFDPQFQNPETRTEFTVPDYRLEWLAARLTLGR